MSSKRKAAVQAARTHDGHFGSFRFAVGFEPSSAPSRSQPAFSSR